MSTRIDDAPLGQERVALTRDDLDSDAGRALCAEYGVADQDGAHIIRLTHEQAQRFGLTERYLLRLAERSETEPSRKVLVVDDDETIRSLLCRLLARRGLVPDTAVDGEHALEKVRTSGDYALIVLDLMMPKLDGFGVLNVLRAERRFVPVIVLSAAGYARTRHVDPYLSVRRSGPPQTRCLREARRESA